MVEIEVDPEDCCGNGCTNCILDNKPKASVRGLLAGKRNVILSYTKFRLLSKRSHNELSEVLELHFGHEDNANGADDDSILDIPPGYHVMLRAVVTANTTPLLRPYSPYWVDNVRRQFKILVKLQPGGPMSTLLSKLQKDHMVEFRGPIGNYVHDAVIAKCIFIITQGIAIAPTMSLIREVLDNEDDMSRIHHMVCASDLEHVYFREELLIYAKYWNYSNCIYLAHQQCEAKVCQSAGGCTVQCSNFQATVRYKESVRLQRLDTKAITAYCVEKKLNADANERVLIIAGHGKFQNTMRAIAANVLEVRQENIHLL